MSQAPSADAAIELLGATRRFKDKLAVDQLSLTVERGRVLGLIGPNGAGKSTTIRMMMDLLEMTAGSVRVLGMDVPTQRDEIKQRVGYVPEQHFIHRWMRVREALGFCRLAPSRQYRGDRLRGGLLVVDGGPDLRCGVAAVQRAEQPDDGRSSGRARTVRVRCGREARFRHGECDGPGSCRLADLVLRAGGRAGTSLPARRILALRATVLAMRRRQQTPTGEATASGWD